MVKLDGYFSAWKQRLLSLKKSFEKIRLLPIDAQFMQALIVRNSCLDFMTELESAFELILSDYVCWQDELFSAAVDDIHLSTFNKKTWPFDMNFPSLLKDQQSRLACDVRYWAEQATRFEASVLLVQDVYKCEVFVIIGELSATYGVSPRIQKKNKS